ncbi:PAAR domain-containing protein [Acinetobacter sp. S40]|uniref:PAAR domain-containing protein n=1 Tax=Acinetobacter sp. S40 TaxID=2767434 RepID=UPI001D0DFD93|nr:PAAR domain-containing protein [Acinetobacter sp. S40]
MAKGFAIHNAPTDHGGFIPSTQVRSSQQGNLFVRAGDGHFCPKCKCWSEVIKSHDHIIMDGKAVAYAGDKLTCGATIQPQQSHVVGNSGSRIRQTMASGFQPINNHPQNNHFIDDSIKKNEIILKEVMVKPFVPLGIPKSNGSLSNGILTFQGSTVNAIFEAIILEV